MQQMQKTAGDAPRAAAAEGHDPERLQLMAAAEQVLERGGWWGFKLDSVLRQARLSTRSFYRHFDGKDDLLSALLEGELLAIADYLKSLGGNASSPTERVWLYIDALIDLSFDHRIVKPASLFALHWRKLLPEYPAVVQRCTLALTTPLAGALDEGRRAGTVSCSDPAADAKAIFFLISSTVFDRPNLAGQAARASAEHIVLPFVERALRVKPQRPASRRSPPDQPARPEAGPAGLQFTLAKYAWDMTGCAR